MIIVFLLLLFIFFLGMILIMKHMMTKNLSSATQHLDTLTEGYAQKQEDIKKQFQEARLEYQKIVEKARKEAEALKSQVSAEVEERKEKIIKEAEQQSEDIVTQAEKTRQLLISEIEEKIAQEASKQVATLIEKTLPDDLCKRLHEAWLEKLIKTGLEEFKNLTVPQGVKEAVITTAFALKNDERQELVSILKKKIGKSISFKEKVKQDIIAGVIISMGNLVFDGSLKHKFQEAARNVQSGENK